MQRRRFLASMASSLAMTGLAMPAIGQPNRALRYVPNAALTVLDPVMSTDNGTINHGYHVFDTLYMPSTATSCRSRRWSPGMQALGLHDAPTVPLGEFFLKTAYRRGLTGIQPAPVPFPWGVAKA